MRYLWMFELLDVPGVLLWDEALSWGRMGDSKVWHFRRHLLRRGAEGGCKGLCCFAQPGL